jgi:inner membrane protein
MQDSVQRIAASARGSQVVRLAFVGFIVLILQIPIVMIGGLVSERQARREAAITEVSSKWGNVQSITGPALVVPYTYRWIETSTDGKQITRTEVRNAVFLPERLHLRGTMNGEVRQRGIFSVQVYTLGVTVDGEFARPDFSELGIEPVSVEWGKAHLAVGISDTRGIQEETAVTWNGTRAPFLPGTKDFTDVGTGIHAMVGVSDATPRFTFAFPLSLNGSLGVHFVPFGRNTTVELSANDSHASFQGNWLPTERTVSADGFTATWKIPFLGRGYPQAWRAESNMRDVIEASRFGVDLMNPVDHYRMAGRSVKYAGLFILLTFVAVWLIEVLAGVRVHPIQYLMVGAALCLFFLLELSLAEHLGFPLAYAVASAAVVTMVGGYGVVALRGVARGLGVGAGVALLYAYLYLLLMNEDYALLIGSIGLFAMLAAIMYATRRVDWDAAGRHGGAT